MIIFLFILLMAVSASAQPLWRASWSTNVPPNLIRVNGANGGAITNIGANGGHYGLWHFYGNESNTVARLDDITNAAGLYVLKYNGFASGLTQTNGTNIGSFTNSGRLDVGGAVNFYGKATNWDNLNVANAIYFNDSADDTFKIFAQINDADSLYGDLVTSATHQWLTAGGNLIWGGGSLDGSGLYALGKISPWLHSYITNYHIQNSTPSRLAAIGSDGILTNSIYSESTIGNILTGTNGQYFVSNGLSVATIKAGFTNGAFWIGTLSNQLMTFWMSNNVTQFKILAP